MNVEHYIKIRVSIADSSYDISLDKDAELYTNKVCDLMIMFLTEQFEQNPDCLIGDIRSLFQRKKKIIEKREDEMTYLEYLQKKYRK